MGDELKRLAQDLIVTAFGAAASLLTSLLLSQFERNLGISLYTFSFWFIIPVGAIGAGLVPAGAYFLGIKLFNHRPSNLILLNMVCVSVGTFFLIHYLTYATLEVSGKLVHEYISFGDYLDFVVRHASIRVGHGRASTGELGGFGYVYAIIQIIGFALGGVVVYGWLASQPYCEKCSRYLLLKDEQIRYSMDSQMFADMVAHINQLFSVRQFQRAIEIHTKFGMYPETNKHYLKSVLEIKECDKCGTNWLRFTGFKRAGDDWNEITGCSLSAFYRGELNIKESEEGKDIGEGQAETNQRVNLDREKCHNHPNRRALSFCHSCRLFFCQECLIDGGEYYYCKNDRCQEKYHELLLKV